MSVQRSFSQNRLLKLGFFLGFHLVQIEQESCSPLEKEGSQSARTEKFFCVNAQQQNYSPLEEGQIYFVLARKWNHFDKKEASFYSTVA